MRLLLDTHVVLWWVMDDDKLAAAAVRRQVQRAADGCGVAVQADEHGHVGRVVARQGDPLELLSASDFSASSLA